MQHISDLSAPPILGQFYMVPTVTAIWCGSLGEYPVIGPLHNDRQHIGFDRDHWHIDTRFAASPRLLKDETNPEYWRRIMATPIMRTWKSSMFSRKEPRSVAAVYARRWKCKRQAPDHISLFEDSATTANEGWKAHFDHWAGHQCKKDGNGWRCPHRNVSLANQPVINGIVRCPLHDLMIDNATGRVLSRPAMRPQIRALRTLNENQPAEANAK